MTSTVPSDEYLCGSIYHVTPGPTCRSALVLAAYNSLNLFVGDLRRDELAYFTNRDGVFGKSRYALRVSQSLRLHHSIMPCYLCSAKTAWPSASQGS